MRKGTPSSRHFVQSQNVNQRVRTNCTQAKSRTRRPAVAHRQRGKDSGHSLPFNAPETWHDPVGAEAIRYIEEPAGAGYVHPVTIAEVRERIEKLPSRFLENLEVVHLSRMTKKKALFPCYGMQWGSTVYLYPIEAGLEETYTRPPTPQQLIDAKMYGGAWTQDGTDWTLTWTEETLKDFYLNSVLIHEIGHIYDDRNTRFQDRERYADWFAIEYGYRASRGRRASKR